jgi:hypothetical protein
LQHQLDKPFGCNILVSPDFDRDTFIAESPFLKQAASSVRVFLDPHDTRIWMSKVLHGSPRVGTMDGSKDNDKLSNVFQLNASMPSHHIPYSVLSTAIPTPVAEVPAANPASAQTAQDDSDTVLSASAHNSVDGVLPTVRN